MEGNDGILKIITYSIIAIAFLIGFFMIKNDFNIKSTENNPIETTETNEVICNKPYIIMGNQCCLDQNDNNICDTEDTKLAEEKAQQELKEEKDAVLKEFNNLVSTINEGMHQSVVEDIIGIKASRCQSKLGGSSDCDYNTIIDGYKVAFIIVYDYNKPGFAWTTTPEISKI